MGQTPRIACTVLRFFDEPDSYGGNCQERRTLVPDQIRTIKVLNTLPISESSCTIQPEAVYIEVRKFIGGVTQKRPGEIYPEKKTSHKPYNWKDGDILRKSNS